MHIVSIPDFFFFLNMYQQPRFFPGSGHSVPVPLTPFFPAHPSAVTAIPADRQSDSVSCSAVGSVLLFFSAQLLSDRFSAADDFWQSAPPAVPGYPDTDPEAPKYLLTRTNVLLL